MQNYDFICQSPRFLALFCCFYVTFASLLQTFVWRNLKKILVTFAVEEERFPLHLDGAEVVEIVTGVGKTLAAKFLVLFLFGVPVNH